MVTLMVPKMEPPGQEWPSLGGQVAAFLQARSVFGPGSLQGQPYVLDEDKLAALWRAYELFPRGHRLAGKRRFKRVGISWRKGLAKTEFAAEIGFAELHPEAPVRFAGWDANGQPVGRPVTRPFIPFMAYTVEQVDELAYATLKYIVEECEDADYFDPGVDRILRLDHRGREDGKAVSLAGSPNANDGARTTFQHFDETHRMTLPRLIDAHSTMLENVPKRPMEDPWSLETTTAGVPGANSVAEGTHREALAVELGEKTDTRLFYIHREAGSHHDLTTKPGRIEAIKEATGPVGEWGLGQFEEIADAWDRPNADKAYLERVWTNRWTQAGAQAFDSLAFAALGEPRGKYTIARGAFCTLGFDGARRRDATGFVLTEIETGIQMPVGLWERPIDAPEDWEVPESEVTEKLEETFDRYDIWRVYADPPYWTDTVGKWAGKWPDKVYEWWTLKRRPMSMAVRAYGEAIGYGILRHNGDPDYVRHVGNAGKVETTMYDEEGRKVILLGKLRPELKFDLCMAGILSWQARLDALSEGALASSDDFVPYRIA